jgi:3-oxoacyl-[acyl-carrier protein] reductase
MNSAPPEGRVAIVTGGARGIGAAIALRLADDGHDIAVLDLSAEDCGQVAEAVQAGGRRALAVGADVSDENSVTAAFERIAQKLGEPTVLVNNAGIIRDHALTNMTVAEWDLVMAVHLRGAFLMSRAAVAPMRAAGWGRIINLSSIAALGNRGQANYSAAKAGIQGFTKTLAIELGRHGITVNAVAPGFTVTAMTAAVAERVGVGFDEMQASASQNIPVGRVGQPEDIANAVAFFADKRSGFVSGQVLYVGGGPFG